MRETVNYKLGLWDMADEVGRGGLNGNFTALDAALKSEAASRAAGDEALWEAVHGKLQMVIGGYVGDDTSDRVIELGFRPKLVVTITPRNNTIPHITIDHPYGAVYGDEFGTIVDNGHKLRSTDRLNSVGVAYTYAALR